MIESPVKTEEEFLSQLVNQQSSCNVETLTMERFSAGLG